MSTQTPQQRAAQRRRRRLIAFVTLPGIVVGTAGVSTAYAQGWMTPPTRTTCQGQVVKAPAKNTFTLNILNATYRTGTAGVVATRAAKQDFHVGTVGNDEQLRTIRGAGEIRFAPDALDAALLVQKQLVPGGRLLPSDDVAPHQVDLVLGKDYRDTDLLPLPPRPPAQASKTVVNVYNTTYYEGLGAKVSQELTHRGFVAGKVGMDPLNTWQQGTALIRYGENGDLNAKLVQQHIPGSTLQLDRRADTSVDVVIGMQLTDLSKLTPLDKVPPQPRYIPPAWPSVIRPCDL